MRDIRSDLIERLQAIRRERDEIQKRLGQLDTDEAIVSSLLEKEEATWAKLQAALPFDSSSSPQRNGKYETPLSRFVLSTLKTEGPCSLNELKNLAQRRVSFGRKNPGRSIHFLLVGMERNGLVERLQDRTWKLKEKNEHA
jgi:hypothetical protein